MTTARESEILERLLLAQPRPQIADQLAISRHTLRHHVQRLLHRHHAADARILVALVWKERYAALQAELAERIRERDTCRRQLAHLDRRSSR